MLDLARSRLGGGIVVKREPTDFKALVERVLREHQAAAPDRLIAARYQGNLAGDWDPERIAQAASNLIGNAVKHGTTAAPIRVFLDGSLPDQVSLTVQNGGT